MTDGFDVHAVRHALKLLADDGETAIFDNRGGVACPVCGDPFDEVLVSRARTQQVQPDRPLDLCLLDADEFHLFTHTRPE